MIWCSAPKFNRRAAALENRGSSTRSARRIARSQDGKVRLPMMLVATVKCSPCGPVKNEQSVAPSTAGSAPISSSDRSTCARSLTASNVAAIATSIYWPCPVVCRLLQRRKDRDHGLQSGIDVGMRQAVGARLGQGLAIMANAVFGKAGFGLHGRRIGHPAAPWPALAVAGDRGVDQPRIALRQRLVVEPEEAAACRRGNSRRRYPRCRRASTPVHRRRERSD